VRCALGRRGVEEALKKREGDGASPLGIWRIRRALYRADRIVLPRTRLPKAVIAPQDGWCDAPSHPCYNKPVKHPFPDSAERLWREDALYDVVLVLGYNDDPVVPGAGSAIFLHVAKPDYSPTEGCVALAREHVLHIVSRASLGDVVEIRRV
jgi:L,D-peptidoglycan transpeptidase YkuD (ErfK/YbiS/YcfS/YnhG family)